MMIQDSQDGDIQNEGGNDDHHISLFFSEDLYLEEMAKVSYKYKGYRITNGEFENLKEDFKSLDDLLRCDGEIKPAFVRDLIEESKKDMKVEPKPITVA